MESGSLRDRRRQAKGERGQGLGGGGPHHERPTVVQHLPAPLFRTCLKVNGKERFPSDWLPCLQNICHAAVGGARFVRERVVPLFNIMPYYVRCLTAGSVL